MPLEKTFHAKKITDRIIRIMYLYLSKNPEGTRLTFAKLLKTNNTSVNRWEYGRRVSTVDDIINTCHAFPEYAQWIVFGGGIEPRPSDKTELKTFNEYLERQAKVRRKARRK